MGTVPTPPTFGANGMAPTTLLNQMRDAVAFAINPPGCIVRRSTVQSIPTNAWTAVTWDIEEFDNDSMFTASSTNITIQTAGAYAIMAAGTLSGVSATCSMAIYVNGTALMITNWPTGRMGAYMSRNFAAGDVVSLNVFQPTGAAQNFDPADFPPRLSVIRGTGSPGS